MNTTPNLTYIIDSTLLKLKLISERLDKASKDLDNTQENLRNLVIVYPRPHGGLSYAC